MVQKLELIWFGKENNIEVEPRILLENSELSNLSNGPSENMLIHGDNLLALKALEQDFSGKIKCIYIDPPYNVRVDNPHYDDNIEHSQWLQGMYPRLQLLRGLLKDTGVIFVQIDDDEMAYLKVLMDEIFGRNNFLNTIAVKMSTASGTKTSHKHKTIIKEKEYILAYAKDKTSINLHPQYIKVSNIDSEFSYFLDKHDSSNPDDWEVLNLKKVLTIHGITPESDEALEFILKNADKVWRRAFIRNEYKTLSQQNPNKIFYVKSDREHYYYRGREMFFLSEKYHKVLTEESEEEEISNLLCDFWPDINTGKLFSEGDVEFRNSKKPELLVARLINLASQPGDFVLDCFLGSGTTAAVSQKMGRRWIGIEMGDHAYTHCKVRLDKVADGSDQGGISKSQNWQGGGGYHFYELAPSLNTKDRFGVKVISGKYNPTMLAAAVAKLEGFNYSPSDACFWKQSQSTENSYLFVTDRIIDVNFLKRIHDEMKDDEFLLISCSSFDSGCAELFSNIRLKKIPDSLLGKCEYGSNGYPLNIVNPPVCDGEDIDEDEE